MVSYLEFSPPEHLRSDVKCFWMYENCGDAKGVTERVLPDGCVELILYYKNNVLNRQTADNQLHKGNRGTLVGQASKFITIKSGGGAVSIIGARFYPWGIHKWLQLPASEITDQSIPLIDIFGNKGKALQEEILNAKNIYAALALLSKFLLSNLPQKSSADILLVQAAKDILRNSNLRIEELAKKHRCSRRFLEVKFNEKIGISPKLFSRIVRLQNTVAGLYKTPVHQLTQLAHNSDYFDQSHFIRDFKELAGLTPREYLEEKHLLSDFLIAR